MQTTSLSPFGVSPADSLPDHSAPWSKVNFSPPADWVESGTEGYDVSLGVREGDHLTHLLMSRQVKAGSGAVYQSNAVRIESEFAVKHESQWSVQLEPQTQTITLHWIRVVRAGQAVDFLDRGHIRLFQRETKSEQTLADAKWTLLVVLDDLRRGDIIETSFTCVTVDVVRPQSTELFFAVPPQAVIGRYRLSVLSDAADTELAWKASADAPDFREVKADEKRRRWVWDGKQIDPRKIEFNQPSSSQDYTWIQVSDLAGWSELSGVIAKSWAQQSDVVGIEAIPAFVRPFDLTANAITRLIQYVQDQFHYVPIAIGVAGWTPASPATVARRGYGDSKDLVWLVATVLRRWGVEARPVLVHSTLQGQVAAFLPALRSLNHVVLEVVFEGAQRWFDLASRAQGGDFNKQAITWFGYGLPVDVKAPPLRPQLGERARAVLIFKETVLLDSRLGEPSLTEHRIWAEGLEADRLRSQYMTLGDDGFARAQEQNAQRRYSKASRVGELQWRDDRVKNTCELVEVFSLNEVVVADPIGRRGYFDVPTNLIAQAFPTPSQETRRTAWALPYPLELRHEIVVKNIGMPHGNRRRRRWTEQSFSASLDEPKIRGEWSKVIQFTVNDPVVPIDQIDAYRKQLERYLVESLWRIYLPWNLQGGNRGGGFGELTPQGEIRRPYAMPTAADETIASTDLSGVPGAMPEGRDGVQAIARAPETPTLDVEEMKRGGNPIIRRPNPIIARPKTKLKMSSLAWGGLWVILFLGMLYALHVRVSGSGF